MSYFIHGDNLSHKIRVEKQSENKRLLTEIQDRYLKWKNENLKITGTTRSDIQKKVKTPKRI